MRSVIKILMAWSVVALAACNSGVFIDDFLPDSSPVLLAEDRNETTVQFADDNWDIIDLSCLHFDWYAEVTDLEGNPKSLPFEDGERGIIRCYNDFFDLRIEKREGRALHIISAENLYDSLVCLSLQTGNRYTLKTIDIHVEPGQKYKIDSVVYDWDNWRLYTYGVIPVDSLLVDNSKGDAPVSVSFYPYKNAVRNITLRFPDGVWEEFKEEYRRCLGLPLPQMVIPDLEEERLVLGNTKITFGVETQQLPAGLDKTLKGERTVAAGEVRRLTIYNSIDEYTVPYKVHVSHPRTGKRRIFEGRLQSQCPKDYLVISEKVVR